MKKKLFSEEFVPVNLQSNCSIAGIEQQSSNRASCNLNCKVRNRCKKSDMELLQAGMILPTYPLALNATHNFSQLNSVF